MNERDVGKCLAFVTAVYPNIDIRDGTVEAWHELLKDLPAELALAAVKKVVAESEVPALPAVGKIRKAALDLQYGYSLPAPEAWGIVLKTVQKHGIYGEEDALKELPENVAQVVRWMGWREICHSDNPDVLRAQFMRMYETQEKRQREIAGLTPVAKEIMNGLGDRLKLNAGNDG